MSICEIKTIFLVFTVFIHCFATMNYKRKRFTSIQFINNARKYTGARYKCPSMVHVQITALASVLTKIGKFATVDNGAPPPSVE